MGISLRRFDGWEPAETTTFRRDRRGRVVQAITVREAEWDEHQQALMLALAEYQSLVHHTCGGYLPETTAADNEGGYVATAPRRCHKCTAIEQTRVNYRESPQPQALLFPVERKGG